MKSFLTFLWLLGSFYSIAQPTLKPSIGIVSLPNDSDSICTFPVFTGNFDSSGYAIGDTIPDFTLYTLAGYPVNMQTVLGQGKPVLLIGGNWTCPVFRNKIATINNMATVYAGQLGIYIVYGIEAHPTTISPYSGAVWITNSNQQAGILHPQPTTYGERKALADSLLANYTVNVPVLIDGLCNEWVSNFGPAPNNAYLIDTTGVVYEKQAWFQKLPDDMYCEIDSLLGTNSGQCNAAGNNAIFQFSFANDTISYGLPGDVLAVHATLSNPSNTDNAELDIIRWQVNAPFSWQTAMCVDVCLPPTTDTTQVTLAPNTTQDFIFYFYTDPVVSGTANAWLGFINRNNNQNKFYRRFWGSTSPVSSLPKIGTQNDIKFYPNPASKQLYIQMDQTLECTIFISNAMGQIVQQLPNQILHNGGALSLEGLSPGFYNITIQTTTQVISKKINIR